MIFAGMAPQCSRLLELRDCFVYFCISPTKYEGALVEFQFVGMFATGIARRGRRWCQRLSPISGNGNRYHPMSVSAPESSARHQGSRRRSRDTDLASLADYQSITVYPYPYSVLRITPPPARDFGVGLVIQSVEVRDQAATQ
jgi:hypothetical protein